MGEAKNTSYEMRFRFLNPFERHLRIWPFKTVDFHGKGRFSSIQPKPSGVTLRYIVSGSWRLKMKGRTASFGPGCVFCAVPSEMISFYQDKEGCRWEWLELQVSGPDAESFLLEFGLSPDSPVVKPADPEGAARILRRLHERIEDPDANPAELVASLFDLVVAIGATKPETKPARPTRAELVRVAKARLESSCKFEGGVELLAEELGVERSTLYRAFKAETGMTPHEWIDELRRDKAKELLLCSGAPVQEAAKQLGFPDAKYFSGWFKAREGLPPGAWRNARLGRK